MINNRGYKLPIDNKNIPQLKKTLTVSPFIPGNKYPEKTPLYRVSDTHFYMPKYFGIEKFGIPSNIIEQEGVPINCHFNGNLRDYQKPEAQKILKELKLNSSCLASLYTGWGKTPLALWVAAELKIKTLIIVHKETLLDQWSKQINFFLGVKPTIIQGKKIDTSGDIVIGMIQSISMKEYPRDTFRDFGLCILDEVHHTPSKVFSNIFYKIGTKYNFGLSATLKRSDGLSFVLSWFLGKTIVNLKQLTQIPTILFHEYYPDKLPEEKFNCAGKIIIPHMVNLLCQDTKRTDIIIQKIRGFHSQNRKILVLTERRNHCEIMYHKLQDLSVGLYIGGMSHDELNETNKKTIIIATYYMASEGYDNPELDTLVLASPRSNIEQSIGRIVRQKNCNDPIVLDIIDQYSIFAAFLNARKRFYISKKMIRQETERTERLENYSFR